MPSTKLRLISHISQLRNKEFIQLYVQLIKLTEKFAAITKDEVLGQVYDKMKGEVERVKQLDVELNVASDSVKARNEVHQEIRNSIRSIKVTIEAFKLSPWENERVNARYIYGKMGHLINTKRIKSITDTVWVIAKVRRVVDEDTTLANALLELRLMPAVEMLYKQGERFEQLDRQKSIEREKAPVIDKRAIRKASNGTLKLLFDVIVVNHAFTKDEVWVEVADEVKWFVEDVVG
ncbi:MAG: DUF6261 family protein [Dysgonamonadaceae bacterium]|nr:DUF6261 family protein [Dysgonamonadaceae bacterium]